LGNRYNALKKLFGIAAKITGNSELLNIEPNTDDRSTYNKQYQMSYNKEDKNNMKHYCGPDWTSGPQSDVKEFAAGSPFRFDFHSEAEKILKAGRNKPIIKKVAWYGNIYSGLPVTNLEYSTRQQLIEFYNKYPELYEFHHVDGKSINKDNKDYMSLENMVSQYNYVLDIGGAGYSGRLKYLLFSNRPLLLVDRPHVEYFHEELVPYTHYIPVKRDLSDLVTQTKWILENPNLAAKIAENARNFAVKEFTPQKFAQRILYVWKNLTK
jgi:hypothetical protein